PQKRGHGQQRVQQQSRLEPNAPPPPSPKPPPHRLYLLIRWVVYWTILRVFLGILHQLDSLLDHPQSLPRDPPLDPS
ncbi:hypothetical protein Tco_0580013, partial [Tanacetum coccineum]